MDTARIEEIWAIVKLRLDLQDDTLKAIVESYIQEIGYRILHYCQISKIPDALNFVWVSMTMDAVRVELPNINEINDTVGSGENIKVGDTSVSPATSNGISNVSKRTIDEIVLNYKIDLQRYRKLRW